MIYLDRDQCTKFKAEYFAECRLLCLASEVLESKGGDGYDQPHLAVLEPLGASEIILRRKLNDPPGWYDLVSEEDEAAYQAIVDREKQDRSDAEQGCPSITVTQRADDWHACITNEPGLWEAGSSRAEAVGKLFLNRQNFGHLMTTIIG